MIAVIMLELYSKPVFSHSEHYNRGKRKGEVSHQLKTHNYYSPVGNPFYIFAPSSKV